MFNDKSSTEISFTDGKNKPWKIGQEIMVIIERIEDES